MTPDDLFVTTRKRPSADQSAEAKRLAQELALPFVPRLGRSIAFHAGEIGRKAALVVSDTGLVLVLDGRRLGFHPNMAARRIGKDSARADHFLSSGPIGSGDSVLDLTCGMGADAITAGHAVGSSGRVVALEASPILARIVARGMTLYPTEDPVLRAAMDRVEVVHTEARAYLATLPSGSFDVVVLDPMFDEAKPGGHGLDMVRLLAHIDTPDAELINAAKRVARRAVLMADGLPGLRLDHFGFAVDNRKRRKLWGRLSADE